MEGQKEFVQIDPNDLFPYLLVNIGSGVSMLKVHFPPFFLILLPSNLSSLYAVTLMNCDLLLKLNLHRLMGMGNLRGLVAQMLVVVRIGAWEGF